MLAAHDAAQNGFQCYILRLVNMLQVYNFSLFRPTSWFAVEKSRSHRHGRGSFIVYSSLSDNEWNLQINIGL